MADTFRKLFNLYPGESKKAGLFVTLGFLWGIGGWGSLTLSEGMFLEHLGSGSLVFSYFSVAITLCLLSSFFIFLINRIPIPWIFSCTLFSSACTLIGMALFLIASRGKAPPEFWFIYKIVGWVIPISNFICFWAFIDQYYDLQDGKRLFCLFNSIVFLSDALGGAIISFGLPTLGAAWILILFACFSLCAISLVYIVTKRVKPVLEEHLETIETVASVSVRSVLTSIAGSRFTLYLLFSYFFMEVLAIVTEFTYMQSFENYFSHENEVTAFLGRCSIWISLGNMVIGIFCYSRIVKKTGVNNIILTAPSFFLLFFCFWFCKEALPIAIIGLIAREGTIYVFDDNNFNLLLAGVPSKIKNQVRITVDSFIQPVGMFFSGCLLFFLHPFNTQLGLLLSLVAIMMMFFLRGHYPRAILKNLVDNRIRFEKKATDWIGQFTKKEAEFLLLSQLKRADEAGQLLAFECLLKLKNPRLLPHLLNHITLLSLKNKLKAIELLSESGWAKEPIVLERLERWRRILFHPAIRNSIQFYFARHGILRPERIIHDLHNKHLGLLGAAILTIKNNPKTPSFQPIAAKKLKFLLESPHEEEVCMGLRILGLEKKEENLSKIIPYLHHPTVSICRMAAKSLLVAADVHGYRFAPVIISRLSAIRDIRARLDCLKTLEILAKADSTGPLILASTHFRASECKYIERIVLGFQAPVSPLLLSLTQNRNLHDRCRLLAGKILGKLDLSLLRKHLYPLIQSEIKRAYFYFYHAHTIQKQMPEHDLTVLSHSLMTSYTSIVDFMIQLIGIANSIAEPEVLTSGVRSYNRKNRAQALESLEKACDGRIFSLLEPLLDDQNTEEKMKRYLKEGGLPFKLNQLLDTMLLSPSLTDQIVSVTLKTRLKIPGWEATGKNQVFQRFDAELLEPTLSRLSD